VRALLAENFEGWVDAVAGASKRRRSASPPATDLRPLAELALTVMEGGVMQARTYRDVGHFDRSVAQLRAYFDSLTVKEGEAA
jgi:TetR/AcrR family transcriptional repressor of nem operon